MPRVYRVEYGTFTNCEPTLRHKMIDKISSWKYTEDYALEPESCLLYTSDAADE